MKLSIAFKKDNKWFAGYLDNNQYYVNKEFKKLSEIKQFSNYVKLDTYLKNKKKDTNKIKKLLESNSVYILEKPVFPVSESNEFNNYWWSEINPLCEDCEKECKQSSKVIVEACKSYKKGE